MPSSLFRLAVLAVLFAAAAQGQTASLARDVNSIGHGQGGSPSALYATAGKLFFAGTGGGATGVWASDGTSSGTVLLANLCFHSGCEDPRLQFLGDLGGTVFWLAYSGESDYLYVLWRSDGTKAGTYRLTGPGTAFPLLDASAHIFYKGFLYFHGCGPGGCRSFRTDGSAAGTVEIPRLGAELLLLSVGDRFFSYVREEEEEDEYELRVTGDPSAGSSTLLGRFSYPGEFLAWTAAGDKLFFLASEDDRRPLQLWVSDGTVAGTRALTDFRVDAAIYPWKLTAVGSRIYFTAVDGVHAEEIWVSDGTPEGTHPATDFSYRRPFLYYSATKEAANGRLVFSAHSGEQATLWSTDGNPGSAVRLPAGIYDESVTLTSSGGRVFFLADDPEHGTELWSTDGTPAGTGLVADICPGPCYSLYTGTQLVAWPGGVLLLGADDGAHGPEIWLSDGTSEGTRRLTELESPFSFEELHHLPPPVLFADEIWFATNGDYQEGGLWAAGGTPPSTRLVARLGLAGPTSYPEHLTAAGGRLYFSAFDGADFGLWSTLGTPESTVLVQAGSRPDYEGKIRGAVAAGSLVFFWQPAVAPSGSEVQLWRTDGTPGNTFLLDSDPDGPRKREGVAFQGRFYFTKQSDLDLWVSDGSVPGTGLFFSAPDPEGIGSLAVAGGALYFTAGDGVWRSDGTAEGTLLIKTIPYAFPARFVTSGPLVFFTAAGRLWKTDGTPAGTQQVDDGLLSPAGLTAFREGVAFFAQFEGSRALFVSDGAAAVRVGFASESCEQEYGKLIAFGGRLYFTAWAAEHGCELWSSDGTGMVMVSDIAPGPSSSSPRELVAAGGRLFFAAGDGVHGTELWSSDGTAAGTRMVQDLNPKASSSEPGQLTVAGDRLYFSADDGITGRELWSYPLAAGPGCQPDSTRLCVSGGRFQVEAAWKDFEGRRGTGQAVALTADTGWFWFFDPSNVETVLKVLDGRGVNNHFWVFNGALTTVEHHLTVTDTLTGAAWRYDNPPGQLASAGDTNGFGPLGAFSSKGLASCQPTAERLCLNGGRFAVEAAWKDFQGNEGTGKAVGLTADAGWFWFFGPANAEVMVKILDGAGLNGKHWVFYGALSNVEYSLTVTDTETGEKKIYKNPAGHFGGLADTGAF